MFCHPKLYLHLKSRGPGSLEVLRPYSLHSSRARAHASHTLVCVLDEVKMSQAEKRINKTILGVGYMEHSASEGSSCIIDCICFFYF